MTNIAEAFQQNRSAFEQAAAPYRVIIKGFDCGHAVGILMTNGAHRHVVRANALTETEIEAHIASAAKELAVIRDRWAAQDAA